MKILTINAGSTSIKFKLYSMPKESVVAYGKIENIGQASPVLSFYSKKYSEDGRKYDIPDHKVGINLIIDKLSDPKAEAIRNRSEIGAIGHRVVHIADYVSSSIIITDKVAGYIKKCSGLAPLHNPPNLLGIVTCMEIFGQIPNIGVFDNIFHKDIPEKAYLYAIPYRYYKKYKIRRYGFHGIAYTYMVDRVSKLLRKDLGRLKIIALMLGGGSSVAAINCGRPIDTSMGFTPTEGIPSSTRCGDIDPAILVYLLKKEDLGPDKIDNIINKESGILGLSRHYQDFREIEKGVLSGDSDCIRAFEAYTYRIKKYIGAYTAAMGGLDAIVFGGGIGENSYMAREAILSGLEYLGIKLDKVKNRSLSGEGTVSSADLGVAVFVAGVDEELVIARESYRLVRKAS
jgi:acetate kinase